MRNIYVYVRLIMDYKCGMPFIYKKRGNTFKRS